MATLVGIDIGATAVKVAVLRTAYRKVQLVALGSCDVVLAGTGPEAIRCAMAAAMGDKITAGDGVATAIEGARGAFRQLTLPQSAQKQIGDVLPFELESLLPFDIADSVWDYRVMTRTETTPDGQIPIFAAVCRIEDVRARIDLVKSALNAEPERVGIGGFPIANLVPLSPQLAEAGPIVLVDLGTQSSEVLVLRGGEPVFARAISFGTQGLPGTAPRLAREIRTTIASFRSIGGAAPAKVVLCGGGSFVSGAQVFLGGELGLPVEVFAPPQLDMTALSPERLTELPRFAKALGLAVGLTGRATGFDLRRGPLAYERGFAWVKEKVPVLAGLAAVVAVSFLFTAWSQLYAQGKDRETLEKALAVVTKDVLGEETTSAARAQELLGQQTALNDEDPLPHADAFDVMVKLSEDIPQSMVHDIEELDVQKGHAVLHGVVGTIPDAQAIATSLRAERCFSDVKISRTNQMVGQDRQKYVLEFDVKCPEDGKGGGKKKDSTGGAGGASSASGAGGK
jgi:general secretion pathway protein L